MATVQKLVTITSNYTATSDDEVILADATTGAITVTLPAAALVGSFRLLIKKIDSSANAVTIDGDGIETIDDSTTRAISTQYSAYKLVSDGAEWWRI